jgi:cytochrome b561
MQNRYFFPHRLVHWAIALLVLGLLAIGTLFWALGHDGIQELFGATFTDTLYTYHKAFGIVVLGLALLSIAFRVLFGRPDYNPPLGWLWRIPSRWTHGLLYIAIVTMPIVGWLGSNAAGHPVQVFKYTMPTLIGEDKPLAEQIFWLHGVIGATLLCLVALHVLAAIFHSKIIRDTITERMRLL